MAVVAVEVSAILMQFDWCVGLSVFSFPLVSFFSLRLFYGSLASKPMLLTFGRKIGQQQGRTSTSIQEAAVDDSKLARFFFAICAMLLPRGSSGEQLFAISLPLCPINSIRHRQDTFRVIFLIDHRRGVFYPQVSTFPNSDGARCMRVGSTTSRRVTGTKHQLQQACANVPDLPPSPAFAEDFAVCAWRYFYEQRNLG